MNRCCYYTWSIIIIYCFKSSITSVLLPISISYGLSPFLLSRLCGWCVDENFIMEAKSLFLLSECSFWFIEEFLWAGCDSLFCFLVYLFRFSDSDLGSTCKKSIPPLPFYPLPSFGFSFSTFFAGLLFSSLWESFANFDVLTDCDDSSLCSAIKSFGLTYILGFAERELCLL